MLELLRAAVLAVMMAWQPHVTDSGEPLEARRLRLAPVAHAIAEETLVATCTGQPEPCRRLWWDPVELAAASLTIVWHESRAAAYVQQGRCTEGPVGSRCDPDRQGKPRARGPWQLWRVAAPRLWETVPGSPEALRWGAHYAHRRWAHAYYRCRRQAPSPVAGAFSGYRAMRCDWPGAGQRETTWRRIVAGLRKRLA